MKAENPYICKHYDADYGECLVIYQGNSKCPECAYIDRLRHERDKYYEEREALAFDNEALISYQDVEDKIT